MTQQNIKINEDPRLSAKRQALLERLLKGKIPENLKAKSIPKRKLYSPVPLSFAQKRLWVLDRLVPGNPFYNFPAAISINSEINLPVFERSINELIRRHESLRTIFKMENEEPVQVIVPELSIKIKVIDFSHLTESEKENETHRFTIAEGSKPFDLERGPLLRVFLLVLAIDKNILFYNMHHIITDGWSIDLFNKEWMIIYKGLLAGNPSPLPEPVVQYADFAVWQKEWLQGETLQKQLLYWKNIIGGDIPILELPADRQRPAISSYRGEKQTIDIPENLTLRLGELNLKAGCTMFMTFLAAFCVLLYRYSGQSDIMIGTPLASRTKPELEEIIGFFSNTLVIRTNLAGNPTFNQLLRRVRSITTEAYDNQELPFERLVEEIQPDRYMNHNPLFQAMLVLENLTKRSSPNGDKNDTFSYIPSHSGTAKFDLWMLIVQSENNIECELEYSTDLFDSDRIIRLLGHFKNVLEAVAVDPRQPIDEIRYLTDEEREQLLANWNETGKEYDIQTLHHMFETQVEKSPDRKALVGENLRLGPVSLSYHELNKQANRLAGLLTEKGVEPGTIVAIQLERGVEMVTGLMGILKSGGTYLPIEPELPRDRIDYMLNDSKAKLMVTTGNLTDEKEKTKTWEGEKILIEEIPETLNTSTTPLSRYTPTLQSTSNLIYVIYTSGSTGKPKGVMVKHKGVSNRIRWMQDAYGLTTEDRVMQKTPYSFDVSVWEFFWTLSYGAGLIMAKPGGHKDSAYLVKTVTREKITTIHFVPTMLNVFLEDPKIGTIRSLKRVICSGEALPLEYQEKFFKLFDQGVEIHNLYGPTEASVDVTYWACERNSLRNTVPIGKPIANTQIYILDRNLNLVPIGVPGELHIGGIQLANGYLNRPELTAEKFCLRQPGGRFLKKLFIGSPHRGALEPHKNFLLTHSPIYKTGDLMRWHPEGIIEFIGRLDFQVKVRGFRIELGEIESNLRECESVSDAVVLVKEDSAAVKTKKLIAYIVPNIMYWKSYRQEESLSGDLSREQVATWQNVFDEAYKKDRGQMDPTFNIAGWNSSYTSAPIPPEEMKTWVDNTVERILSFKPRQVMEIGCGTGLFLFRIIPNCQMFIGTDISIEGLNYIENQLREIKQPGWAEVRTMHRSADNFDGIEPGNLDMIFLNSVVQYFPTVDYLVEVLEKAANKIKPGGHIFIGDIRSLPLLKLLHTSVELSKAEPGTDKETILRRALNKISLEQELLIDPGFFDVLKKRIPRIKYVERLIKYGRYTNELSKFRYDVILRIGEEDKDIPLIQPQFVLDWKKEKPGIAGIKKLVTQLAKEEHEPGYIIITSVPNAHILQDVRDMKRLHNTENHGNETGFFPDDFLELEKEIPYHVSVHVSPLPGEEVSFDVVLTHQNLNEEMPGAYTADNHLSLNQGKTFELASYTNNPLLVKISGSLIPQLRDHLKERLPEYMSPSHFVLIERLPITSNGKLDREVLPEPTLLWYDPTKDFSEPSTEMEVFLAQLWREVLNLEKVSVNHNFFGLGGDSVNAIQVVSRANKAGVKISVQLLFQNQTIEELAAAATKDTPKTNITFEDSCNEFTKSLDLEAILKQLPPGTEIEDIYPASPLQLHQVQFMKTHDTEATPMFLFQKRLLPMNFTIEVDELEKVLQIVSERYRVMRTLLIWKNVPEPVQVICKKLEFALFYHDLSSIPTEKKLPEIYKIMKEDWDRSFECDKSSPMRVGICKLEENLTHFSFTGDFTRMDGWSTYEFSQEIVAFYMIYRAGANIPPPALHANCYKEYVHTIRILRKQMENPAEHYWRSVFKDFNGMKSLTSIPGNQLEHGSGFGVSHFYLLPDVSARMEQFLMEHRLSLSPFIQGAWAALLAIYLHQDQVVYGMMTTGRSIPIAGIEHMTGHSINILPMVVPIAKKKPLLDYFKEVRELQTEWTRYDYTQLDQVYEWLDIRGDLPLFDHYIVIQNLASAKGEIRGMERDKANWKRQAELIFSKMDYPLRIEVFSGYEYGFVFHYYLRSFSTPIIKGLMANFKTLIETIIEDPRQTFEEWTKPVDMDKYKLVENESSDSFIQS